MYSKMYNMHLNLFSVFLENANIHIILKKVQHILKKMFSVHYKNDWCAFIKCLRCIEKPQHAVGKMKTEK